MYFPATMNIDVEQSQTSELWNTYDSIKMAFLQGLSPKQLPPKHMGVLLEDNVSDCM